MYRKTCITGIRSHLQHVPEHPCIFRISNENRAGTCYAAAKSQDTDNVIIQWISTVRMRIR